ncbi:acyl-CoA synthetase [Tardiphaga sp. 215_C5_N2_1]|uniref:acyl-CoA synthetase n=1 Tax=Tardiphaga sp. 215_C5_N2_1 TaxID=3240774 RepID=UPI003F8ABB96
MSHPRYVAQSTPEKIAYEVAGSTTRVTYRTLEERSNQGANLFRALGLKAGDNVAFLLENRIELLEICWAAQRAGLYYTAVSTQLTAAEVAYIVEDCDANVFITSDKYAVIAGALRCMTPSVRHRLAIGGLVEGHRDWDHELSSRKHTPIDDEIAGYDMLYSSGTTGRPKGVKVPFLNEPFDAPSKSALRKLFIERFGFGSDTIYLSTAPLYHGAPLRANLTVAAVGGTSIVMERFDAEAFLSLVQKHRVTHTQLVPTMLVRLLKLPEEARARYDLSSLKCVVHGAGPCAPTIKDKVIKWLGPIVFEYYGGTEGNGIAAIDSMQWLSHRGSVGKAVVADLKIVGKSGEELAVNTAGVVYFANGRKFVYHKDPIKTAAAYNEKGWSTLGDIGYLDSEGFLYLTDRMAFTIVSGGVNVYPQEVENTLVDHPKVSDVAVFGVPSEEFGEEVKAVVQLANGLEAGCDLEAELILFCREKLSPIKCPKSIDFIAELPREPSGKLQKGVLRDRYWSKQPERIG